MQFARGFRLHPCHGPALDGAQFPGGHVVLLEAPEHAQFVGAPSIDDLVRGGYHGARIEWADQASAEEQPADGEEQR